MPGRKDVGAGGAGRVRSRLEERLVIGQRKQTRPLGRSKDSICREVPDKGSRRLPTELTANVIMFLHHR